MLPVIRQYPGHGSAPLCDDQAFRAESIQQRQALLLELGSTHGCWLNRSILHRLDILYDWSFHVCPVVWMELFPPPYRSVTGRGAFFT